MLQARRRLLLRAGADPMYRSWVIDTLLCPNWSAAALAVSPAESIRLATVFRKMWDVSPGRPISAKASRIRDGCSPGHEGW